MANVLIQGPSTVTHPYSNSEASSSTNEKKLNGLVPFFLKETFVNLISKDKNEQVTSTAKALQIQALTLNTPNRIDIVKTGRLACVVFKDGDIQKLTIHPYWHDKIMQEQVKELAVKLNEHEAAIVQANVGLVKMTEQSYQKMVITFNLANL